MEQGFFAARAYGGQRFRPKVADFKNEGDTLPPRQPPSGESDQQLGRSGDDYVGLRQIEPAQRRRETERRVIANSFVRFTVGQRPEPGANDFHSIDGLDVTKLAEARLPILWDNAGRMVGKSG